MKLLIIFLTFIMAVRMEGITYPTLPPDRNVVQIIPFPSGGRVDWALNGTIYYDAPNKGITVPYMVNKDGSGNRAMVYPATSFNVGNPAISPDGSKILFQVASATGYTTNPGIGYSNNVWLGTLAGNTISTWSQVSFMPGQGSVLHPKFSPDGSRMAWTQASNSIAWTINVANVNGNNPLSFNPLGGKYNTPHFYEFGCWSDNSTLYFVATDQNNNAWKNIYSFNIDSGVLTQITNTTGTWFEFPQVRNGRLAYVSSENTGSQPISMSWYPLDLWVRNADGTNPRRITTYNLAGGTYSFKVADISWDATGTELAALIYAMPQRYEGVAIITP